MVGVTPEGKSVNAGKITAHSGQTITQGAGRTNRNILRGLRRKATTETQKHEERVAESTSTFGCRQDDIGFSSHSAK